MSGFSWIGSLVYCVSSVDLRGGFSLQFSSLSSSWLGWECKLYTIMYIYLLLSYNHIFIDPARQQVELKKWHLKDVRHYIHDVCWTHGIKYYILYYFCSSLGQNLDLHVIFFFVHTLSQLWTLLDERWQTIVELHKTMINSIYSVKGEYCSSSLYMRAQWETHWAKASKGLWILFFLNWHKKIKI